LSGGEGGPAEGISRIHAVWDVVEEEAETVAAEAEKLFEALFEMSAIGGARVADIQSWTQAVDELDLAIGARGDQSFEIGGFNFGVKFTPDGAVFEVVFGGVEIGVEPPTGHPTEEFGSFGWGPRRAVEAFDHSSEKHRIHAHLICDNASVDAMSLAR